MSEILDERYTVAEEAIQEAFMIVLGEKQLEKITVSDIIRKAGIVRSTFYNHYENIPELAAAVEEKMLEDIFRLMESFHPKNDEDLCYSYFLSLCDYTEKNPFLAELLQSPRGDDFFGRAMQMFHRYVREVMAQKKQDTANQEEVSYMIACTIGSALGVLHKWTAEDCRLPKENVAGILTKAFMSGMLPFLG